MNFECLFLLLLTVLTEANELTRCCSSGARHFRQTLKCSETQTEGSGVSCARAASICCLRALLDQSCDQGISVAQDNDFCSFNLRSLGGGTKKECCECCLLARELSRHYGFCDAPVGFSGTCLKSFNKCCTQDGRTHPIPRISHTKCAHFCNDKNGDDVECSCRSGYDLAPDGFSCIDIDECSLMVKGMRTTCKSNELCENVEGGYRCYDPNQHSVMRDLSSVQSKDVISSLEESQDKEPSLSEVIAPTSLTIQKFVNIIGKTVTPKVCPHGMVLSATGNCVDIDECLFLVDNCLEGQLCLNTPGSFKCIRTLSCGTGYALSSDTEQCIDVDECNLGSHDCGPLYQCRNTKGSYRCDPKTCPEGQIINSQTGECSVIDCPVGYKPSENGCIDLDECQDAGRCHQFEECINTPGSYRCQEQGNLCTSGHRMDRNTGFCIDIDECAEGTHTCGDNPCINLIGTYKCRCPVGFDFNETTMRCEDIDECTRYAGHVCSLQATCENTFGSFRCHCNAGYKLAEDGRNCEDIDECELGIAKCAQRCINIPGSYQCICERGYQLGSDGVTCEDTDECAIWAGIKDLCMGDCINTPGSFKCNCPDGYELQADGLTCTDIDECQKGECQGSEKICVNTLGSFKCHHIKCPINYVRDKNYKNRCNRERGACGTLIVSACKNIPLHISWQYIAIPRLIPLSDHLTSITLFTIKGPTNPATTAQFELILKQSIPEHAGIIPAVRSNFLLQKGEAINSAVIALRDSLDGPQEVQLELAFRLSVNNNFYGKFIANLIIYVGAYKRQRHLVF